MKKIILLSTFLFLVFAFSACTSKQENSSVSAPATNQPAAKSGETTKTGKMIQAGGAYFIETSDGSRQKLDSYSVDLSGFVNQTVTVTGQYSGDDLFVGKVE